MLQQTTRFRVLRHVAECGSTQDLAAAEAGDQPAVFWAEHQTAGRGRHGRTWHDEPGADLAVTFALPGLRLDKPLWLAAAAPLAVLEALEPHAGTALRLKWPNDLMLRGRKLAGILIDSLAAKPGTWLVGVGVNANRTRFPPELGEAATSLALHTGHEVALPDLLRDVAQSLDRALAEMEAGRIDRLQELFTQRTGLLGRDVVVRTADRRAEGRLARLDFDGLELEGGATFPLGLVLELGAVS